MKGVILAGGLGTRLYPLTLATNKHLLPIFDKPMIYYPINTLVKAGITDILIVVSGPHAGHFLPILKNGEDFGCKITYAFQHKPDGGIADALSLAEDFAGKEDICLILGDNTTDADISESISNFEKRDNNEVPQCTLFLKYVKDPKGFGVVRFDHQSEISEIIEKPEFPPSNFAVIGLYLYDKNVFDFVRNCKPSHRGQLEITDVNNLYLKNGIVHDTTLAPEVFWSDAGTFENLYRSNQFWFDKSNEENE